MIRREPRNQGRTIRQGYGILHGFHDTTLSSFGKNFYKAKNYYMHFDGKCKQLVHAVMMLLESNTHPQLHFPVHIIFGKDHRPA